MRRLFVIALVLTLMAALAPIGRTGTEALALVRVEVTSRSEAQHLLTHFDETHNHGDGHIELLLWPGDAARLDALGVDYEIVEDDVIARDRAALVPGPVVPLPGPDRDTYRRLPDYVTELEDLAKKNPRLVDLVEMPHPTLEGRTVFGVEIAAPGGNLGRPAFYVDGIHHAREWPAAEYPMIFAHHLVDKFKESARVRRILNQTRIIVVPVVNPDGFDYSRESLIDAQGTASLPLAILGAEAYWRKNRRSLTGVTVPVAQKNPDAYGIDPNRNYALLWGEDENGSSSFELNQTYRGSAPFSEPETQNVRELMLSTNITGVITNHTYGRLVLRPWGHTSQNSPDEGVLARVGQDLADAMGGYQNIKGIGLYATHGTTDDWAYGALGALGYTFEHGEAFHPPYATSVGEQWRGVIEAFLIMAEATSKPRNHSVIEGRVLLAGRPVDANLTLTKSFKTPLGDGNPTGKEAIRERLRLTLSTDKDGRFEWHVNPSTRPIPEVKGKESYTLTIKAGGRVKKISVTVDRGKVRELGTIRL